MRIARTISIEKRDTDAISSILRCPRGVFILDMEIDIDEWIWIKCMSNGYGFELLYGVAYYMKQE